MDKEDFIAVTVSFTTGMIIGIVLGLILGKLQFSARGFKVLTDERGEVIGVAPV